MALDKATTEDVSKGLLMHPHVAALDRTPVASLFCNLMIGASIIQQNMSHDDATTEDPKGFQVVADASACRVQALDRTPAAPQPPQPPPAQSHPGHGLDQLHQKSIFKVKPTKPQAANDQERPLSGPSHTAGVALRPQTGAAAAGRLVTPPGDCREGAHSRGRQRERSAAGPLSPGSLFDEAAAAAAAASKPVRPELLQPGLISGKGVASCVLANTLCSH